MKKDRIYNIENVVKKKFCTGCGTCLALCPRGAIRLIKDEKRGVYVPTINKSKCNDCGICLKVCPGAFKNLKFFNQTISSENFKNTLIGGYINCYIGHSTDNNIRYNSASGGLITSLLIYALERGIIGGALVTRMKKDNPLEAESFIARTREEILGASKSKYCPVPVNIGLKEILKAKKEERFAVVGLPCHIHGIRKAETINGELKGKIILHLGIFCSHGFNFNGTEFFLHKLGIKKEKVVNISYRGGGWPGKIQIDLLDGKRKCISSQDFFWSAVFNGLFFVPRRCLLCNDLTNEVADISFGDPWLREITKGEKLGKSIIITRSEFGEKLINLAKKDKYINLLPLNINKVIQSQKTFLHFKKINIKERERILNVFDRKDSFLSVNKRKISFYNKLIALILIVNGYLGSRLNILLRNTPIKILKLYKSAFYKLYGVVVKKDFGNLKFKKEYNILILHAHWGNRGDEAAIRAMIDSFKEASSIGKIKVMLITSDSDIQYFPYDDIEIVPFYPFPKIYYLDALLILITFGKLSITKKGRSFLEAISRADFVIHAPGGPAIGDLYRGKLYDFPYLYRLLVVKVFKKRPLFFYAPSMGPFSGRIRNFIRKFILKKADAIILREAISAKYLKDQLGLNSYVTVDSALQNKIPDNYIERYMNNLEISEIWKMIRKEKVVGITITDLKWHMKYGDNTDLRKRIMQSLIELSRYIIKNDYKILLIPQLFGESFERLELPLLYQVSKINNKKIAILSRELDAYAQQVIISKLFCFIGMRYHSNIFAAKNKIPFIPIYYEHKMEGFLKELRLGGLMIDVKDINAEKIIKRFKYLERNYNTIKELLNKRVPKLIMKSQKTTEIILKKIRNLNNKSQN